MEVTMNKQLQEYLLAWTNWYYGKSKYPKRLQDGLTWDQKLEAIRRTEQLKTIFGKDSNP